MENCYKYFFFGFLNGTSWWKGTRGRGEARIPLFFTFVTIVSTPLLVPFAEPHKEDFFLSIEIIQFLEVLTLYYRTNYF